MFKQNKHIQALWWTCSQVLNLENVSALDSYENAYCKSVATLNLPILFMENALRDDSQNPTVNWLAVLGGCHYLEQ